MYTVSVTEKPRRANSHATITRRASKRRAEEVVGLGGSEELGEAVLGFGEGDVADG